MHFAGAHTCSSSTLAKKMLELIIIIRFCMKAGEKLKGKGYKPLKYYFIYPVVWFATEFLVAFTISIIYYIVTKNEQGPNLGLVYMPALICAFMTAIFINNRIDKKPDSRAIDEPIVTR